MFYGTDQIAPEGDLSACQSILVEAVDIRSHQSNSPGGFVMADIRLNSEGIPVLLAGSPEGLPLEIKVLGNELVRAAVLLYYVRLPH